MTSVVNTVITIGLVYNARSIQKVTNALREATLLNKKLTATPKKWCTVDFIISYKM